MFRILSRVLLSAPLGLLSVSILLVFLLRVVPPPTTSFMLQSPTKPVRYEWVPAAQIAEVMRKAAVASEDQLFWTHHGFDLEAMQKAYEHNQKHRKQRGGSTISQQTAKNLFLWQGGGYARKAIEAYFTWLMEATWPKQRILEVYLNVAEFGPGVYGVEAASRAYLGKSAAQLSAADAALLAAVLPSPRRWRVVAPGPYVQSRASWILRQIGYGPKRRDDEEPVDPSESPALAPETEPDLAPSPMAGQPVIAEPPPEAAPTAPGEAATPQEPAAEPK